MLDKTLSEAKRLYEIGFAIHLLYPKSKRPIEMGWTTGPRKEWKEIEKNYRPGMNIGTRLGTASKIKDGFLAVLDIDIKSNDERHVKEAAKTLEGITKNQALPEVKSGRGNGSRHLYMVTPKVVVPKKLIVSPEITKVYMPSVKPSKKELAALTKEELEDGIRMRPAWEIALMGEGQQVVLPPSFHPDSGKRYVWQSDFNIDMASGFNIDFALKGFDIVPPTTALPPKDKNGNVNLDFTVEVVDLSWLNIHDNIRQMIITGAGVEDRSAMLLPITHALYNAGLTKNEILSVLTDPLNYIGQTAYTHAQTANRTRAALWLWKYTVKKVFDARSAEYMFREPVKEVIELEAAEMAEQERSFDELGTWQDKLSYTDKGVIRPTLQNVVLILENTISKGAIQRDLFCIRDYYAEGTPWGGVPGCAITDDDVVALRYWLGRNYGIEPSKEILYDTFTMMSKHNAHDPIIDWLESLPPWDETQRLDTWLEKYFGAVVSKEVGHREYLAEVFRKWVCGMVLRAYKPGAHFPWMPIFEGAQGVGKSSFGRILVGEKYFLDWLPDLHDKDASLSLQGAWAVEMGELAGIRKTDIEVIKAFLTRKIDKFRPPHGRKNIESYRRCVFFGTTNNVTYLKDDSGNRRFKPLEVGQLDFEQLASDREQLFAEAIYLVKSGFEGEHTTELTGNALLFERAIQGKKMVKDEADLMAEKMLDFYHKNIESNLFPFDEFSMGEAFDAGPIHAPFTKWQFTPRNAQFAGKALKMIGATSFHTKRGNRWKLKLGG